MAFPRKALEFGISCCAQNPQNQFKDEDHHNLSTSMTDSMVSVHFAGEIDPKSYGIRHREAIPINKRNRKKPRYHDIKSTASGAKIYRTLVNSELNHFTKKENRGERLEEYMEPTRSRVKTYTWWDCKPEKPNVWSNSHS